MVYNNGSFLPGSVVLCYFASLASVYGNSVALLRAQLKLVSCWYSAECCFVKQIHRHSDFSSLIQSLVYRRAVTSSSWSSRLRCWVNNFIYQNPVQERSTDHKDHFEFLGPSLLA